jgi:hypothetical protein
METGVLGFSVRIAMTDDDFHQARTVRAAAYGHHDPQIGSRFGAADPMDRAEGTVVLLCRDKQTGAGIGTARIQVSGFGPLLLENSLTLPEWLANKPRAQISRLAVLAGAESVVKLSLMKASYQYCLATQVRWMVIGARNAALIRNYRNLGFKDVFEPGAWVPLASGGGLPHQILAFDVVGARAAWQATRNRLYGFMTETTHADLQVVTAPAHQPEHAVAVNDSAMAPLALAA